MTEEQKLDTEEGAGDQVREAGVAEDKPAKPAVEEGYPTEELSGIVEEGPAVGEETALRHELEETKAREAEYLDGWQRARAELANARKRFQREQEQAYTNARADVLCRLLPIVDDFERAFETSPDNPTSPDWIEGVRLIWHKFQVLLEQESVAPIEATGQEFDPFLHQALTHEPSAEVPQGYVIAEMQRGYKMGDRVLRPSIVRVSSGPFTPPEPETEKERTEEMEAAATDTGATETADIEEAAADTAASEQSSPNRP